MAISVNHIVIPAHDHEASAQWFARIMGLDYKGLEQHFAPVRVNESFTLDFYKSDNFQGYHIAFKIDDADFDGILRHLQTLGISYGNDPRDVANMKTDHPFGGQGLYFLDSNFHLFEVMTKSA